MTQAALTIVGYAVGNYFLPGIGGQIGAAVGGYIGGSLAAPDVRGPRISDTTIQGASYGTPIVRSWGTDRVAGSLIWAGPMQEQEIDSSGKGGPDVTTYSYSRSFAVLIETGPIGAVRRIWADAALVYDVSDTASGEANIGSQDFASYMTIYRGTEAQLPDPTIEAVEGAGNVPAYRGYAYVVFDSLPLAAYGNRIPNLRFEVSPESAADDETVYLEPLGVPAWRLDADGKPVATPADPNSDDDEGPMEFSCSRPFVSGTFTTLQDALDAAVARALVMNGSGGAHGNPYATQFLTYFTGTNDIPACFTGGASLDDDPEYVYYVFVTQTPDIISDEGAIGVSAVCSALDGAGIACDDSSVLFSRGSWDSAVLSSNGGLVSHAPFGAAIFGNNCHVDLWPPECKAYLASANVIAVRRLTRCQEQRCFTGDPCTNVDQIAQAPGQSAYCITCAGDVSPNGYFAETAGTYKQLTVDEWTGAGTARYRSRPAQGPVIASTDSRYNDAAFWAAAAAASTYGVPGPYSSSGSAGFYPRTVSTVCAFTASQTVVAAGSALLSDIVTDVCELAGLSSSDIDVSDLTDSVRGYSLARQMSARDALAPLRSAYFFDAVESGALIKFVKRGGAVAMTIDADDLAAAVEDSDGDSVPTTRAQEAEIPSAVSVVYKSVDADYEVGTQTSRRTAGSSRQTLTVELPIVLTDDAAAAIADVLLYDAWVARNARTFSATRRYMTLEPTDVIEITDGALTYRLMISGLEAADGVLSFKARDDDPECLVTNSLGAPTAGGASDVQYAGPTRLELLDIPILRDDDDNAGFYLAATGILSGWRSATVFRSLDAGSNYSSLQDVARAATMGLASTALGDYGGGNTIDEINTVTVEVQGELASITTASLLNDGNAALLGDEVIQFKRATLVSTGVYELSGLLRGRRGTEQHMATHAVGDRFVLLTPSGLYRPVPQSSDVGLASVCKAVTTGGTLGGAPAIDFTNTAAGQKPLSPVHLNVAPLAAGGYACTWVRRTRISPAWVDASDVPIGEASESYRVRVLDGDTVVSEQTVTSPEATVGASLPSDTLTAALTLSAQAWYLAAVSGGAVGVLYGVGSQSVVRFNDVGALVAQSPVLGSSQTIQACHGTDAIFVLSYFTSGPAYADTTVYRIAYGAETAIAASRASSIAGDFQGVAFDGTYLWIAEVSTGLLHRCSPTTLATLSSYPVSTAASIGRIYFEGGYLWITEAGDEVVQWNVSSHTVVGRLRVTGKRAEQVVAGDGVVFIETGYLGPSTGTLWSFDTTASPSLPLVSTDATIRPSVGSASMARLGDYLFVCAGAYGVDVRSAATGAYVATIDIYADFISGVTADSIYLSRLATASTVEYESGAAIVADDLSGMTLEIAQISAAVGAGFTVTVTIE